MNSMCEELKMSPTSHMFIVNARLHCVNNTFPMKLRLSKSYQQFVSSYFPEYDNYSSKHT